MSELRIQIPKSIEMYKEHLGMFFGGMLDKLDRNSHKSTPTIHTVPKIMDHLQMEVKEFEDQFFTDKSDPNTLVELYDVANFAFLAYVALVMHRTRP